MRPERSAVIAGAGIAGLASAVALDELGFRVTLVEKKPIAGGRAFSFSDRVSGIEIDNGQHLLAGAYHESLKLLERVGSRHHVRWRRPTTVPIYDATLRRHVFRLGNLPPPWGLIAAILGFGGLGWRDKFSLIKWGRELKAIARGNGVPAGLTARDWLAKAGQSSRAIRDFWEVFVLATLNDSADRAPAEDLAAVLTRCYFAGPSDGFLIFPEAPLSRVFAAPTLAYLRLRGHAVLLDTALKTARILDRRVHAFILDGGTELTADLYVSALPPDRLSLVLPEPFLAAEPSLAGIGRFAYSPIVSVVLFFDRPVMEDEFAGSAGTAVHWYFDKGRAGNTYRVAGVISGADAFLDGSKAEITSLAREGLMRLYPKATGARLMRSLVSIERRATIRRPPASSPLRPRQRVLDNFYVVGDWTRTGLPPTIESAALSARLMADDVAIQHWPTAADPR